MQSACAYIVICHLSGLCGILPQYLTKGKICGKKREGKGKAIPLQAWTGPEGSRRLRLPDFKTVGT
jgi:hypothetical protein